MNYRVTLYNCLGAVAWTGDFEHEDEAVVCLENAEVAAAEMKGRAEMEPAKKQRDVAD